MRLSGACSERNERWPKGFGFYPICKSHYPVAASGLGTTVPEAHTGGSKQQQERREEDDGQDGQEPAKRLSWRTAKDDKRALSW